MLHPVPIEERNPDNVFVLPLDYGIRNRLLDWIDEHTVGDFYVGSQLIYFVEDADATTYILFNMDERVKNDEF